MRGEWLGMRDKVLVGRCDGDYSSSIFDYAFQKKNPLYWFNLLHDFRGWGARFWHSTG